MEKSIYNGKVLYAYQVLQSFDFERTIRSCHSLTCCDCGAPVFFKHGKQRAECFAHYKREECKYGEYCSKQSNIFKHTQRELYAPLQRIAEKYGYQLEEDVVIIREHYTAFVLRSSNVKYAIDIIDTAVTATTLDKRRLQYENSGYHYLQITVDKDAESEPFSERDMAYFPVKYALNKSKNHTALVIDKESQKWYIYILDNMDTSDICCYDDPDWLLFDTYAKPVSVDDIDLDRKGFFTVNTTAEFNRYREYRQSEKAKYLMAESERKERQRKQAEETRKMAEAFRTEQEKRIKEAEERKRQEAEAKKAAIDAARQKAAQDAEERRLKRIDDEKAEILHIHQTTGGYVGSKTKGKYDVSTLEQLTASRPSRDWLCEYQYSDFMDRINEIREYKQSGVRILFAKLCFLKASEKPILMQIISELESADQETVMVIKCLMQKAGIE